jgi:hypothetical protein
LGTVVEGEWWGDYGPEWEPRSLEQNFYGYQQLTGYAGYDKSLTEQTELSLAFSYDFSDYKRFVNNGLADAYREDEYYGRALVRHTFNDAQGRTGRRSIAS